MSEEQDKSQKTEEPSQRKLEEAKSKGQVISSKEVNSFLTILFLTIIVCWSAPFISSEITLILANFIKNPHLMIDNSNHSSITFYNIILVLFRETSYLILLPLLFILIGNVIGSLLQHGIVFSPKALSFDFQKISPFAGFKRIFSLNSVVELLKGLAKITLIGIAIYITVKPDLPNIHSVYFLSYSGINDLIKQLINKTLMAACVMMSFLAVLDYLYQRHKYLSNLRMTKHEVKEEHKQQEGSAEIKSKLKSIRMKRAKTRMMAEVPKADVIITNPTHYAIALKYDIDSMLAPLVVAKGKDHLALIIKEIAKEYNIPIVEKPELARSLFANVEVSQYVDYGHYQAVAEVIAYVMKLKGKKLGQKVLKK